MIRVNLLAVGSAPAAKRDLFPAPQRAGLAGAVLFLATLAALGYWWRDLGQQTAAIDVRIAQSDRALNQLKAASALVDKAMARKAELSEKIALIERLRKSQRGPVSLLSTISRSLPDGLWL